jgi:hypothetical protein
MALVGLVMERFEGQHAKLPLMLLTKRDYGIYLGAI